MPGRTEVLGIVGCALIAGMLALSGCSKKSTSASLNVGPDRHQQENAPSGSSDEVDRDAMAGLSDVYFPFDDYRLTDIARSTLSFNAAQLKESGALHVTIEGHCDERGTTEYNLALGQRRADAARKYLVDLGIDAGRLSSVSYGEERPFALGHDETAWSQNRRAHFAEGVPLPQ